MSAERVARLVAANFPGPETTVTDVEWAWRIRINANTYCCLRKDMLWALTSAGSSFDIFDDLHQPLSEQEMVLKLMGIFLGLLAQQPITEAGTLLTPHRPISTSLVTSPQLIESEPRSRPVGMVRKKELDRLQAEANIFKHYKH